MIIVTLTNVSTDGCSLLGYPRWQLVDRAGRRLPFTVAHQPMFLTRAAPRSVFLPPHASAYAAFEKFRCDLGQEAEVAGGYMTPPGDVAALAVTVSINLGYCGTGDPGSQLLTTPVEPTYASVIHP